MKPINRRECLRLILFTIPVCFLCVLLIYVYGDLLLKNLPILFKLFAINNSNHLNHNENNNKLNISNSFSKNIVQLNPNHSNITLIDYSISIKHQLFLKNHNVPLRLPEQPNCGLTKSRIFKRIVRGSEAVPHSFPWMASLKHAKNGQILDHFCAGSLIYDNYVLTAAHCIFGLKIENFVVALGLHYLNDSSMSSKVFKVNKVIIHEQYNHKGPNFDIALIRLANKVVISKHISTICLPDSFLLTDLILNEYAIVAGWGRDPDATIDSSRKLQQTVLKIINGQQLCSKHLQTFDYTNLYCAHDTNVVKNSNVCIGDSGGPLMFYMNKKFYTFGIVSFVFTYIDTDNKWKCYTQAPSYYTKVTKYIEWLSRNLNEDNYFK